MERKAKNFKTEFIIQIVFNLLSNLNLFTNPIYKDKMKLTINPQI